jgi:hypothetical protein
MAETHDDPLDLDACRETLQRLEAEVALLRDASNAFADLAERLSTQLKLLRGQLRGGAESIERS